MAQLTDYLPTINSGKETIQPVRPGPSIFESLSGLAGNAMAAHEGAQQVRAKKEAAKRQAAADALDASDRGAKNFAAEAILLTGTAENAPESPMITDPGMQEVFTGGTPVGNVGGNPIDQPAPLTHAEIEELTLAQGAGDQIGQQAAQWQRGVKQGRISASRYELMLEEALRQGFRKFPESKYVMLEEIKKYGVDHPIMSEYRAAQKAVENEADAAGKREEAAIDFAVTKLGMDPTHDRQTLISAGFKGQSDAYALEQAKAAYTHSVEVAKNNTNEIKAANEARDQAVSKFVHGQLGSQFGASLDLFNSIVQDKTISEPDRLKAASEFINVFRPKAYSIIDQNLTVAVSQHGMSQKTADDERQRLRSQVDDIFAQFSSDNPLNVIVTNGKVLQTMKDRFQLDLQDAMPVYQQFKQAFGSSESVDVLVETIAADPKLQAAFTREMKGFQGLTQGDQTIRIRNMLAFMGDQNTALRDYSPQESAQIIKDSANLLNNGLYRLAKNGDASAQRTVLNALGKVSNAATDLNAGSSTRSLVNAINFVANGNAYDTLLNLSSEHKEFGNLVADEARVATGKALMSLIQQKSGDPYHRWGINEKTKRFEIVPTGKRAHRASVTGGSGFMKAEMMPPTTYLPAPSAELKATVSAMNRGLTFLMATTPFEDSPLLKSASHDEKFRFYTRGELPESAKPKEGTTQSGRTQISRLQNFWANFKVDWASIPKVDIEGEVARTTGRPRGDTPYNVVVGFGRYGTPPKPLTTMSMNEVVEFGKNVLIPNTKAAGIGRDERGLLGSSAAGAFQITQSTLTEWAPKVFGENWRDLTFSPENQEKLAKALFEANKGGNLKRTWAGLPDSTPGAYKNKTWEEMKEIIIEAESD